MLELDKLVRSALTNLVKDVSTNVWSGQREREVVSLFCFGHLLKECRSGGFLQDFTQVGIEVPVPQIAEQAAFTGKASSKEQVCKDIVIWSKPRMTCWDSSGNATIRPS